MANCAYTSRITDAVAFTVATRLAAFTNWFMSWKLTWHETLYLRRPQLRLGILGTFFHKQPRSRGGCSKHPLRQFVQYVFFFVSDVIEDLKVISPEEVLVPPEGSFRTMVRLLSYAHAFGL